MGLIGNKRETWVSSCKLEDATHLFCFKTGYMEDEDDDGEHIPYGVEGRVYKIENRTEYDIYIHSECCEQRDYASHSFPPNREELLELGFIPVRK